MADWKRMCKTLILADGYIEEKEAETEELRSQLEEARKRDAAWEERSTLVKTMLERNHQLQQAVEDLTNSFK